MYCKYCGSELKDDANFCPNCGKAVNESPTLNTMKPNQNTSEDTGSIGWGVLGFFIPLAGLILFLVWRQSRPKDSLMAGKGALISVIVSFALTIFSIILNLLVR